MIRSPSLTVGTNPFGLSARYSGSRLPPKVPPTSTRSNGRSSSAQHHSTFCTFDELARPQIFSMALSSVIGPAVIMEPPFSPTQPACGGLYASGPFGRGDADEARYSDTRPPPSPYAGPGAGGQPAGYRGDEEL